jgi:hypothetical protein
MIEVNVFEPDPAHICIRNGGRWSLSMNPNMFGRVSHIRYMNGAECDLINAALDAGFAAGKASIEGYPELPDRIYTTHAVPKDSTFTDIVNK